MMYRALGSFNQISPRPSKAVATTQYGRLGTRGTRPICVRGLAPTCVSLCATTPQERAPEAAVGGVTRGIIFVNAAAARGDDVGQTFTAVGTGIRIRSLLALSRTPHTGLTSRRRIQKRRLATATASAADANGGSGIERDRICELAASNIRYGTGATAEVGLDLVESHGARRVLVVTDRNVRRLGCMGVLMDSLSRNALDVNVFDDVRVEPNDVSFKAAIEFASSPGEDGDRPRFDAIVALGGGSVIDTAKAMNLYSCHPPKGDFYDYVNPPLGKGIPPPGPLLPLIAIPTTAGTGSETTGVAIFDDSPTRSKTGVGHRRLRPTLGVIDPDNTATLPPDVARYSGLDVLCHALESYTALPFDRRPKPKSPLHRPAYQGSNPISDVWSLHGLRTCVKYLRRAVDDPSDEEARSNMLLAAASAGVGFGNAGVQLCHGMSYPVSSQVKTYRPPDGSGYDGVDHAMVPHGRSVIVNAPSAFRFTGPACPGRHWECAEILAEGRGATLSRRTGDADGDGEGAGAALADEILELMHLLDVPVGLGALGYGESDVEDLVRGTLPQHRVIKLCPRPVGEEDLVELFRDAL